MERFQILYGKDEGQALLEVAIFGTMLVFLLGVLLSYGLNYLYTQQAEMEAFRRAVSEGNKGVTYMYFKDRHIPNPSNPFAMGDFVLISASSAVTFDPWLSATPDPGALADLPAMKADMNGVIREFKTAGYRKEGDIQKIGTAPNSSIDRYEQVYPVVVCKGKDKYYCSESGLYYDEQTTCNTNCVDWEGYPVLCSLELLLEDANYCYNAEIMDACEGEIVNYDSCRKQCMVIVDNRACGYDTSDPQITKVNDCACEVECEAGRQAGSDIDCGLVCSRAMNTPWYCQPGTGGRTFALDDLFQDAAYPTYRNAMGLQPGQVKSATTTTGLTKQEGQYTDAKYNYPTAIATTDAVDWDESITRRFIYHANHLTCNDGAELPERVSDCSDDGSDNDGYSIGRAGNIIAVVIDGGTNEIRTTKWITPW